MTGLVPVIHSAPSLPEAQRNATAQEIWRLVADKKWQIGLLGQARAGRAAASSATGWRISTAASAFPNTAAPLGRRALNSGSINKAHRAAGGRPADRRARGPTRSAGRYAPCRNGARRDCGTWRRYRRSMRRRAAHRAIRPDPCRLSDRPRRARHVGSGSLGP
jgi:hypothetical protein